MGTRRTGTVALLWVVCAAALPASDCDGEECSRARTKSQQQDYPWTSSPNCPLTKRRRSAIHRDASAVLPYRYGLTEHAEQSRSCCKNGGTCILGSFCACPPFFTGRNCEYDQRVRSCGLISHGEWVQKGCSYCRCGYGILHCFANIFHKDCAFLSFPADDSEELRWLRSSASRVEVKSLLAAAQLSFLLLLLL
uniref:EGF-like domain-containing protein n=1 Tax=Tetraodon nigroviridis TaxID=99883 RepID=H3C6J2_TETNG